MSNGLRYITSSVASFFLRSIPYGRVLYSAFNTRNVNKQTVKRTYTDQLTTPTAYRSSAGITRLAGVGAQGSTSIARAAQPKIRRRISHLHENGHISAIPAPTAPSSRHQALPCQAAPAPVYSGSLRQALIRQQISAQQRGLTGEQAMVQAIEMSKRTHQQEAAKRAAEAQAMAHKQDPQLQQALAASLQSLSEEQALALATKESKKTHRLEGAMRATRTDTVLSVTDRRKEAISQARQQSYREYQLMQEGIVRQKSAVPSMLNRFGYDFKDVPRDGNCFYHALATHYSDRVDATFMRKVIVEEGWKFSEEYVNGDRSYSGYGDELHKRLVEEEDLNKMQQSGHYADLTDIILAARKLGRAIMVVDRSGNNRLAVNSQGKPIEGIRSLSDNRRLPNNAIIMVLDQTLDNKPGSYHFMVAAR